MKNETPSSENFPRIREKIFGFLKKEPVLTAALLLAVLSVIFVPIDKEYLSYIDFRTLSILFCLMSVMAGLRSLGVFRFTAEFLIGKVKSIFSLLLILVLLCFFFSMIITNDVALITFVPLTFSLTGFLSPAIRKKLLIPIVVLQTIAANLGSMLTPIGNPQNLYLYGKAGLSFSAFIRLMLPFSLLSLLLLILCCFIVSAKISSLPNQTDSFANDSSEFQGNPRKLLFWALLFLVSLLTVVRILPYPISFGITAGCILVFERDILKKVDYSLLLTFCGFFIFIGNMGRIPAFSSLLQNFMEGKTVLTAILASQAISNVPAALLLSGFTSDYFSLIIGTNLGGLGTLIASMASLISYKQIAADPDTSKSRYLFLFTLLNIAFLLILTAAVWGMGLLL